MCVCARCDVAVRLQLIAPSRGCLQHVANIRLERPGHGDSAVPADAAKGRADDGLPDGNGRDGDEQDCAGSRDEAGIHFKRT